jgi:hypothetical protein
MVGAGASHLPCRDERVRRWWCDAGGDDHRAVAPGLGKRFFTAPPMVACAAIS